MKAKKDKMRKNKLITASNVLIIMICCMTWCAPSCYAWPRGERVTEKHWLIVNFIPRQYTYAQILQNKKLFDMYYKKLDTNKEKRQARWDYQSAHGG